MSSCFRPERVPAWLPDWRDASAYPGTGCRVRSLWAWDFLRRNDAYRRDFELLRLGVLAAPTVAERWSLLEPVDPARSWKSFDRNTALFVARHRTRVIRADTPPLALRSLSPDEIALVYSPGRPKAAQLAEFKACIDFHHRTRNLKFAKKEPDRAAKLYPAMWHRALRVVDAYAVSDDPLDAARAIKNTLPRVPHDKRAATDFVRNARKLGDEMIAGGYRSILA